MSDGYGPVPGGGASTLLKSGSGDGIVVQVAAQLRNLSIESIQGNDGGGVLVLGGRSVTQDASVFGQGLDDVKVGARSADKFITNLWRLQNVICRTNGRRGLFVAHEGMGQSPNVNAGLLLGYDGGLNGGDGVRVSEAVDNQFVGVTVQSNWGRGVALSGTARGNVLLAPYAEASQAGEVELEGGADRNMILGVRSRQNNSGVVNRGVGNVVWRRCGTVTTMPLHETPEAFVQLGILERSGSGVWRFSKQPGSRHLCVQLADIATGADVLLQSDGVGSSGLRFATDQGSAAQRDIRIKQQVVVKGISQAPRKGRDLPADLKEVGAQHLLMASQLLTPSPALTWVAFWGSASQKVVLRVVNGGRSQLVVDGAFLLGGLQVG